MGGVDGDCWFCRHKMENLCDHPVFTGYTVNGGYAEYAPVRADFTIPLPQGLDDSHLAPLLCAGIIGFRSLRVAGIEHGERVGLFGFGSSASLAIRILQSWECDVYVVTRGESHRNAAQSLGATWVDNEDEKPPPELVLHDEQSRKSGFLLLIGNQKEKEFSELLVNRSSYELLR
jgi:alcohol dehydrogenase, propanol-preferring